MLDATAGVAAGQAAASSTAMMGGLDSEAFMNLLIAQMRYQDPMSPTDPGAMMQQTSVLAQTEMLQQVTSLQQQLLGLQQATTAGSMVGHHVTAYLDDGTRVAGFVDSIEFTARGPMLHIDGQVVPLGTASIVSAQAPASDPAGAATEPVAEPTVADTTTTSDTTTSDTTTTDPDGPAAAVP